MYIIIFLVNTAKTPFKLQPEKVIFIHITLEIHIYSKYIYPTCFCEYVFFAGVSGTPETTLTLPFSVGKIYNQSRKHKKK